MPYRYATQGALHHAAALENPPADRVEGHLAGLQRELEALSFVKNEVPAGDQQRLLAAAPWVARYLTDERPRVRYSSSIILLTIGKIHGDLPCDPIAARLLADTAWIEDEAVAEAILADRMPPDIYPRLELLLACADRRPEVAALAGRVLSNPRLEASADQYNDAWSIRRLAEDLIAEAESQPEGPHAWRVWWLRRRAER